MSRRDLWGLEKGIVEESDDRSDTFVKGKDGESLGRDTEDRRVKENRSP